MVYKLFFVVLLVTSCQVASKSEVGSGPISAVESSLDVNLEAGPQPNQLRITVGKHFPASANAVTIHLDTKDTVGRLVIKDAQTQQPVMQPTTSNGHSRTVA